MQKFLKIRKFNLFNKFQIINVFPKSKVLKFNSKSFCNILKLNFDKLSLDKIDSGDWVNFEKKEAKDYNKEDFIIEFGPHVKWEECVLNSEIPVVVDCYAP